MAMSLLAVMLAALPSAFALYAVPALPSNNKPVFDGFVSYSIEFASFPDFAGNKSAPNTFSNNLLDNVAALIGTKPYIRVGGNTQDYALYDANLKIALNGTINPARSSDYPTTVTIGPSFFESYATWNATKFSHGFNLGLGGNSSAGWQTLLDTAPLACEALGPERLYVWEYGNEPDLYSTSAQGPVRSPSWNEAEYVAQWMNGTRKIKELVAKHCPELATNASYGYMAPSFAGTGNHLRAPKAFQAGLAGDGDIKLFSTHNYISGATSPGVTLQGTLMNHATTKQSVDGHITEYNSLGAAGSSIPLIFGEANSLYNEGKPGLSNSFGAALWGIDFNLYSASVGFRRVHMHQGTNYRYASWQPIQTTKATIGTKPPYYGNVAVAAFLAGSATSEVSVVSVPLSTNQEAAYAAYVDGHLARLMVINLVAYNYTINGLGPGLNPAARPSYNYTFQLPAAVEASSVGVQRLYANGSDALSGITFDGWSYNYELAHGRPVRLSNVTVGETLPVSGGQVTVTVPASQAVILNVAPPLASGCPAE